MAVINANCVAIYYLEGSSSKRAVSSASSGAYPTGSIILNGAGQFVGVASGNSTLETLVLAGAATNSVVEVSNAVENVARDGSGGMLQETNQTFSLTADGLIQDSNDTGTDIMKMAIDKDYVVCVWSVGESGSEVEFAGQALIDTVTLTGAVDEIATYSVSLTGVDDIYVKA